MNLLKKIFSIFKPKFLPKHLITGIQGEKHTIRYLKKVKNCTILERNWRFGHGEIDIIAQDPDRILLFIEVKTRRWDAPVPGFYSVSFQKKSILRKTALGYLKTRRYKVKHFRFDIAEVRLGPEDNYSINYYSNVLLFQKHAIV